MFDLHQLKKDPNNPRLPMTEKQFAALKKSIKKDPEFMTVRPIVYDKNKTIRAGNCRFDACLSLDLENVPDNWVVDCSEWPETKLKRFQLVDNSPPGISADWDWSKVQEWPVEELEEWGLWEETPNFDAVGEEEQGKLDQKKSIICPECGVEFVHK